MSTAIAANEKVTSWLSNPEAKSKIGSALGGWMHDDTFVAQIMIAFQSDAIKPCSEASKFKAAHDCASLQLLPSLNQVALIPRNCKVTWRDSDGQEHERWELQCHVMPQWQGYKSLMERNPEILEVNYGVVFNGEQYLLDENNNIVHTFDPFSGTREVNKTISNIKGGYLTIVYRDSTRPNKTHFVTVEHIRKAKACAKAANIWNTWPTQMVIKTLYRDGYARRAVPIDTMINRDLQKLTDCEDAALDNDPARPSRMVVNPRHIEQAKQRAAMDSGSHVKQIESSDDAEKEHSEQVEDAEATTPPVEEAQKKSDLLSEFISAIARLKKPESVKERLAEFGQRTSDPDVFAELENVAVNHINHLESA